MSTSEVYLDVPALNQWVCVRASVARPSGRDGAAGTSGLGSAITKTIEHGWRRMVEVRFAHRHQPNSPMRRVQPNLFSDRSLGMLRRAIQNLSITDIPDSV